jgi:hypothetical protein
MVPDVATVLGIVVGVVVAAFAVLLVVGVTLLARRARSSALAPPAGRTDAGVALVRADDALRSGADDLGFAIAQFGEDRTRAFKAALDQGRIDLDKAFRLQQQLEDVTPDSDAQRVAWTHEIRTLAERTSAAIAAEASGFEQLRRSEANAPETLRLLRRNLEAIDGRRTASAATVADLKKTFVDAAIAPVAHNLDDAAAALTTARKAADEAEAALAAASHKPGRVPAVIDSIQAAQQAGAQAGQLLDAIDRRRDELAKAQASVAAIVMEETTTLEAARTLRDAPPDPDSGAAVNTAIAFTESELADIKKPGRRDPVADLDRLVDASDKLDIAVAAARNQQRRLDGAREALAGALVSARTQLGAVSDYIGSHGGGADARTRLAEGQRNLTIAENEADPVDALDAARRAQTNARDADALARY